MSPEGGAPIGEPRPADPRNVESTTDMAHATDGATTTSTENQPEVKPEDKVDSKAEASATPATEPKAEDTAAKTDSVAAKDTTSTDDAKGLPKGALWGGGALILALLAFFGLRSRKSEEKEPEAKKPMTVSIQKKVEPTSKAQLTALEKTVDEAVKNGTTAGAMGAGSMAYAMAKQEEERAKAAEEKPLADVEAKATDANPDAVEKLTNEQPWLAPDDELPPLDAEDTRSPEETAKAAKQTAAVIDSVTLDLDDEAEPKAADTKADTQDAETKDAPQAMPESDKERALWQALDAKLKLASSFVGLGALKEALELLDEVKRRGNPDQRERAQFLENRIKSRTDAEK